MSTFESTITRKGQITLPAELRRKFDLREGDKVAIVVNDESNARMIVQPLRPVHERPARTSARRNEPIDLDVARRLFEESRAEAYATMNRDQTPIDPSR